MLISYNSSLYGTRNLLIFIKIKNMNSFKFGTALKYVLELFLASVLTIMIIKLSFWLLNLASTLGNIAGGALFLTTLVSYIYYIVGYVRRVNNHLNNL